uniref:ATP-binding cassette sub-family C member 1 n=1 Tax=Lepeophtheirus salmonis TaxID=72036 RepID=A0A0K2TGK0_LEPSM
MNESWICEEPLWNQVSDSWKTLDHPNVSSCFRIFFFRLIFPNLCFFYVWLPFEVHPIYSSRDKGIKRSLLGTLKDLFAFFCVSVAIYDVIHEAFFKPNFQILEILDPSLRILTYTLVLVLNFLYRVKGMRISGFLCRFFFVSLFSFGIDLYLMYEVMTQLKLEELMSSIIHVTLLLLNVLAHFWPEPPPRYSEYVRLVGVEGCHNPSPDTQCGYPSYIFFSWMSSLMWKGFKRPIKQKDLWDFIPSVNTALVNPHFLKHWNKIYTQTKFSNYPTSKSPSIFPALLRSYWPLLLKGAFAKLLHDLLLICSPMLLQYLILFSYSPDIPLGQGIALSVILFGNKILGTFFIARYFFYMVTVGMKLKTSITSLIYRKALRIHSTRDDTTSGEIVNLMSVDVQKIVDLMPLLNTIWSGPLQIIAAIYLLINTLGYSALAGVLVMFLLIPINGFIAVRMKNAQMKQMKKKDERVKKMNEILQGIKIIKLYAWESSFSKLISSIRFEEIKLLKLSSKYFGFMMLTISSTTFFISLFTFIVYVVSDPENHILDSEKIFVSISLFNILRFPLNMLTHVIGGIASASVSLKRINKFLASEELEEGILVRSNSHDHQAICIHPSSSFSWKGSSESLFKDISMDVNRGNLIAIIGPVGSGKSSLISALLGEMLFTSKGTNPVEIHGSVAYTPQNAWMQNVSVKDNILFGRKFNKNWYDEVLKACSLESDMEVFPSGDSTEIGEKGINLSGGQKQRISLARAVYSQSDIYFLDDPLAAVDSHVAKHLFEEVIGSNGLLRGKTRILVTHNLSFLHLVDEIYFLKDGEITEKGTYKELMEKNCDFSELISNHANNKITNQSDSEKVMEKINEEGTKQPIETNFKIYDEETLHTGQVGIRVYWYFLSKIGMLAGILAFSFFIISQILATGSSVWLSVWSDAKNNTDIYYHLGIYAGLGVSNIFISTAGTLILSLSLLDASRILHGTLFQCIIKTPMSFFDTTPLGRILNRFGQDIEVLDTKMSFCIFGSMTGTFAYIATVTIISINVPIFIIPTLAIFVVYFVILIVSLSSSRQLKRLSSVATSPIYSHFGETLSGINTVRAYSLEKAFYSEFERRLDEYQKRNFPVIMADRWLGIRINLIGNFIIFASALFSVLSRDTITPVISIRLFVFLTSVLLF